MVRMAEETNLVTDGSAAAKRPLQGTASGFLSGGGELGHLIRDFAWGDTRWARRRPGRTTFGWRCGSCSTSRQPIWIGWGQELTYFYNDPYKSIIGGKHPWALGRPTAEVWHEIWGDIGPMLDTAMSGEPRNLSWKPSF